MEADNQDHEALRRRLLFSAEAAAMKPMIYDIEERAFKSAVLAHLRREPPMDDMRLVSKRQVPELDAWLLYPFGDAIGMVVLQRSKFASVPDSWIYYPSLG